MSGCTAIGLFSGGLDSILACRVVAAQGIHVRALKFVTPFFDHHLLAHEERFRREVQEKYGLTAELVDLSGRYIQMLRNPVHGYGKNFNPCIDCKILMLATARAIMESCGASFIVTGEVLGQRPMSQRRDTLRVIERDSGCDGLLLRPLSAKLLPPTRAEEQGLVDRKRLHAFSGRGRRQQIALADRFNIDEYPAPAGGCMLTDCNLGTRIARFYDGQLLLTPDLLERADFLLMRVGRQFRLSDGPWLVMGRNATENEQVARLAGPGDCLLAMVDRPGPLALVRRADLTVQGSPWAARSLQEAASLLVRYARKVEGMPAAGTVEITSPGGMVHRTDAEPLAEESVRARQI